MSVFVSVMFCQVEVSTTGLSLVQRTSTKCGVYECDREASTMKRSCSTRACRIMGEKIPGRNSLILYPMIDVS